MSARDAILGRLRRQLAVGADDAARKAAVKARLTRPPVGVIPARGQLQPAQRRALFRTLARKAYASIAEVAGPPDVPVAVADYLRTHNLAPEVRMGSDTRLAGLPWERTPQLAIRSGASDGEDAVGVSHAEFGIAETGTLLLISGRSNPTTISFLPETHIVVLRGADITGDFETAWAAIRNRHGRGHLPRTVNLITGPSRSADIEQTMLLGAHGPRRLHIIIVGS